MKHARKDYDRIQDAALIATTIPCWDTGEGDCPGCLNGTFEDGVIVFRCNECGQEAGRGAFEPEQAGGIPKDELVFLVRSKDEVAPDTVRYWAMRAAKAGAAPKMVQTALLHADAMERQQSERGKQVPDMPEDVHGES